MEIIMHISCSLLYVDSKITNLVNITQTTWKRLWHLITGKIIFELSRLLETSLGTVLH